MMPARVPEEGSGGPPSLVAMLAYQSCGFSVIPILPGTKKPFGLLLPEGKWRKYQQTRASTDEINQWCNLRPDTGIGIVCGEVSGGLYCLDCDDVEFSTYVETDWVASLADSGAWVERSGSGKIHVFVKCRSRTPGGALIGGGKKLADIRGDGQAPRGPSYMVVAPTLHEKTNEPYSLLAGDPAYIHYVKDALALFDMIRDGFTGSVGGAINLNPDEGFDTNDQSMLEANPDGWLQIEAEIKRDGRISRRVKLALLNGAEAGEGMWTGAPSNSELDHHVIRELRTSSWTPEKIEQAFAWGPLGNHRYRNHKGTSGHGYIVSSIVKIDQERADQTDAASKAEGANFRIDRAVRLGFDEPIYELYTTYGNSPERRGVVRVVVDDLMDEHRFARAFTKALGFMPVVHHSLEGRKFRAFGDNVVRMATEESVPTETKSFGYLRSLILSFVLQESALFEPDDQRQVTLAWRLNGHAYIRKGSLLMRLKNVVTPAPKPEAVWSALLGLGAEEIGHKWPDGKVEPVWVMPVGEAHVETNQ